MANLEKLDRIHVNQDDYKKIIDWANANRDKYEEKDIPIHEGILEIEQEFMGQKVVGLVHFKLSDQGIYLCTYDGRDNAKLSSTLINEKTDPFNLDVTIHDDKFRSPKLKGMVQKDLQGQILLLLDIFLYMQHNREYVQADKQGRQIKKKSRSGKPSGKPSASRVTRITRTVYSFDYTNEGVEKRKYERHTESWTQRGFWRHYKKSGKTVWIEPQIKGSGKNVTPKTYKV